MLENTFTDFIRHRKCYKYYLNGNFCVTFRAFVWYNNWHCTTHIVYWNTIHSTHYVLGHNTLCIGTQHTICIRTQDILSVHSVTDHPSCLCCITRLMFVLYNTILWTNLPLVSVFSTPQILVLYLERTIGSTKR